MLTTLLLARALAGDVFDSAGAESDIGIGGTWARMHASEDGWWFFQNSGGDAWVDDLEPDFSGYDDRARLQLSHRGDFQDIQVERCDDGGWLGVGSASVDSPGDSAYGFRTLADFSPVGEFTIDEATPDRVHQDMVVMCSHVVTGALFSNTPDDGSGFGDGSTFIDVDGITAGDHHVLEGPAVGTSMAIRPSDRRVVAATFERAGSRDIQFTVFDPDWSVVEEAGATVAADYALWTQRLLPLGDGWLLVHILRPDEFGQPEGEVWIEALNADFEIVDSIRASPEGSTTNNRPWIARRGDVIAVTYDRSVQPRFTTVLLKADALPDDDDGIPDTGAADDTAGTMDCCKPDADLPCGCAAAASPGIPAALLGLLAVRRRRSRPLQGA